MHYMMMPMQVFAIFSNYQLLEEDLLDHVNLTKQF